MANTKQTGNKAWVVAVDMGYGHQRAAFPFKDIAYQRIFSANSDKILSSEERKSWSKMRSHYERVSRLSQHKYFGKFIFWLYDRFQYIASYYPYRDLSRPNFAVLYFDKLIRKKDLCKSIIQYVKTKDIPFITTFYLIAIAADAAGVKNVYCIVTDSDINRVWVAKDPKKSNITYLAPCDRVVKRLIEYGVKEDKVILTGFPLPKENLGNRSLDILKKDLSRRMSILDPNLIFYKKYKETIDKRLNIKKLNKYSTPPTLTFTIGGAGAQRDLALDLVKSLKNKLLNNKINLNIVVGMHFDLAQHLSSEVEKMALSKLFGKSLNIIYGINKKEYFTLFSEVLRKTDILWTKPSEMSFYSALGLPLIISPAIGAHEGYNKRWILDLGGGIEQKDIKFTNEWLFDMIKSGRLAEAAWNGFIDAPNKGIYNIEDVVFKKR